MKDSNTIIADNNAEYCSDISVDIANTTDINHILIPNVYSIGELDDFTGTDTRAMGEKVCIIVVKTDLNTAKTIYDMIKRNSDIEIGKVRATFNIQNEETRAFESNAVELDDYVCFRSIEMLYLNPNLVSIAIRLSTTKFVE